MAWLQVAASLSTAGASAGQPSHARHHGLEGTSMSFLLQ
jgi:hypothetical protein